MKSTKKQKLKEILENSKSILVIGTSHNYLKPSHIVTKYLLDNNYNITIINPNSKEKILNQPTYSSLDNIPKNQKFDILLIFRPSKETEQILKNVLDNSIPIKTVWLQEGIKNPETKKLAESYNLNYIEDKCIMKTHKELIKHQKQKSKNYCGY